MIGLLRGKSYKISPGGISDFVYKYILLSIAQSAGAGEYTDCTAAEG